MPAKNPHAEMTDTKLAQAIAKANLKAAGLYERRDTALADGNHKLVATLKGQIIDANVERDGLEQEQLRRQRLAADIANPNRGVTKVSV